MIIYHAQKTSFFSEGRLWMKKGVDLFNVTVAMYGVSQVLNYWDIFVSENLWKLWQK